MHRDNQHFDAITRALAAIPRRRVLRALVGTGFAAGLDALLHPGNSAARRKKRRRKRCQEGEQRCGKRCVTTLTNRNHCGGCGQACAAGETCCNGACQDTQSDTQHCGGCTTVCRRGESCVGGTCGLGQGTCQAGDDTCIPGGTVGCNNVASCGCTVRFTQEDLVCGRIAACTDCNEDADCAGVAAEAYCARKTGTVCCTNLAVGQGFCAIPCRV